MSDLITLIGMAAAVITLILLMNMQAKQVRETLDLHVGLLKKEIKLLQLQKDELQERLEDLADKIDERFSSLESDVENHKSDFDAWLSGDGVRGNTSWESEVLSVVKNDLHDTDSVLGGVVAARIGGYIDAHYAISPKT